MRYSAKRLRAILTLALVSSVSLIALARPAAAAPTGPIEVSLAAAFNNDALSDPGSPDGDFDGVGNTYPADQLPAAGSTTLDGVPFQWPAADAANNIAATGQQITVEPGAYSTVHLLVAGSYGDASGTLRFDYTDGTSGSATITAPDWYSGPAGALNSSLRRSPNGGTEAHAGHIYSISAPADAAHTLSTITLPNTALPAANTTSLHVFAVTLSPAVAGPAPTINSVRSTTRRNANGAQLVDVTITNSGNAWISPADPVTVQVLGSGVRTTAPATIAHLAPGEQARVEVGIAGSVPAGTSVVAVVTATTTSGYLTSQDASLTVGVPTYTATSASIGSHEAPGWFNDAKFGIFIHWGPYSAPAWAPVGREYAEWYWAHLDDPNSDTAAHHRDTYSTQFVYDDFIPQFTAANYNPTALIDLIGDSGAKYWVLTSKHHDGFALYNSAVSGRDSVDLGPHRDLVKELFDASRAERQALHPGLYFSMPEWFNPDNPWLGHAPRNSFTGQPVPYTGYSAGRDYVQDYQAPQMLEIIRQYAPEVLWCDIGGVNDSQRVFAEYFNRAEASGRPVTVNDRCGIDQHDFTTPEYTTYDNLVTAKWETNRGLDPFSYGYNAATPDNAYMTADQVVSTLVDTVSKNGNFLLDIGPEADGSIPAIMQQRLREAGAWLAVNGEAIYGSTYWLPAQREVGPGKDLRFTVKQNDAFYITSLLQPGNQLIVDSPVPIQAGDQVTMLGYPDALTWTKNSAGQLIIAVPNAAIAAGHHAWTFKIAWQ